MSMYEDEVVIHAATDPEIIYAGRRGLVTRNYRTHPVGYYVGEEAFGDTDIELVPESEYADRVKDLLATKSQLSDIRNVGNFGKVIPALDQDGFGYCWAHSSSSCHHLLRAQANLAYVPLSAFSVAATIKNGRDEGGWGAQSLDFIVARGQMPQSLWPQGSAKLSYGTDANWQKAKDYRVTEGFATMSVAQYDRRLTFQQVCSCLLNRIPVVVDFNWWSHSVAAIDVVLGASVRDTYRLRTGKMPSLQEFDRIFAMDDPVTAGVSIRILNSWGNSWSANGTGVLSGSQAVPDGAVAPRFMTMSARGARPGEPAWNFNFTRRKSAVARHTPLALAV